MQSGAPAADGASAAVVSPCVRRPSLKKTLRTLRTALLVALLVGPQEVSALSLVRAWWVYWA